MPKGQKKNVSDKDNGTQQVPVRIHRNDYRALRKLFLDEHWSVQKFVSACVDLYLNRDPLFLRSINEWQEENNTPKELKDYSHSPREANALYKEIEGDE